MKNRDPLPLLIVAVLVLLVLDEIFPALALLALWFFGVMGDLERVEEALKRGDIFKWSESEPD